MCRNPKIVGGFGKSYPNGILDIYSHRITAGIQPKEKWEIQIKHIPKKEEKPYG